MFDDMTPFILRTFESDKNILVNAITDYIYTVSRLDDAHRKVYQEQSVKLLQSGGTTNVLIGTLTLLALGSEGESND